MKNGKLSRRRFLKTSSALAAAGLTSGHKAVSAADGAKSKSDRLRIGAIGLRYQGSVIARHAAAYGDLVALCDVDAEIAAKARQEFGDKADVYEDYRRLLDRRDIDRNPRSLARPNAHRRLPRRKRCLLREAADPDGRRRQAHCPRGGGNATRRSGRNLAAQRREISAGRRNGSRRAGRPRAQSDDRAGKERAGRAICRHRAAETSQLESMAGPDRCHAVHRRAGTLHLSLVV